MDGAAPRIESCFFFNFILRIVCEYVICPSWFAQLDLLSYQKKASSKLAWPIQ